MTKANKQKWLPIQKVTTDDLNAHKFSAVISTDTIDRDREVLLPRGMDARDFTKAGMPVFWNHNYDMPIAKGLSIKQGDHEIRASAQFAERPEDHVGEFYPDTFRALVNQGIANGVSVGFDPVEERKPTKADKEKFGEDVRRVFTSWKLTEFSIAPVQSNTDALVTGIEKGLIKKANAKIVCPEIDLEAAFENRKRKVYIYLPSAPPKPKRRPAKKKTIKQMVVEATGESLADLRGELYR